MHIKAGIKKLDSFDFKINGKYIDAAWFAHTLRQILEAMDEPKEIYGKPVFLQDLESRLSRLEETNNKILITLYGAGILKAVKPSPECKEKHCSCAYCLTKGKPYNQDHKPCICTKLLVSIPRDVAAEWLERYEGSGYLPSEGYILRDAIRTALQNGKEGT